MIARAFLVVLLLSSLGLASDETTGRADAMFLRADNEENVRQPGSPAFHLSANLTVWGKSFPGSYDLKWQDPQHWRGELKIDNFEELEVRNGDNLYRQRNVPFRPDVERMWADLLKGTEPLRDRTPGHEAKAKSIKTKRGASGALSCAKLEDDEECCFDEQHGWMMSTRRTSWDGTAGTEESHYEDFQEFGSKSYPRNMNTIRAGKPVLQARVTALEASPNLAGALFAPPPRAEVWPVCDYMEHAKAIRVPDPSYTETARRKHIQGTVVLTVRVGADGKVERADIAQSLEPTLDAAARDVILQWVFKPAMCGNTPVPTEITVTTNFRVD